MKESAITKTVKDTINPEMKKDIPYNAVKFGNSWTFWETYTSKTVEIDYNDSNKLIFKWDDLITFFQFWNKYPGKDIKNILFDGNNVKYFFSEKYRINSMNIFKEGIKPMWEDEQNKGGKYYQMDYQIKKEDMDDFSKLARDHWKKLALCTMGGTIPNADYINGIRFVDKTDFKRGRIIMFRIEVWVKKNMEENKLKELEKYLSENLGCQKVIIKDINI
jgi:hypothetical protein